ncbi:MAG: PD40 domain-containing protein [Gemmatimonadales bacterium]|nr:PD40 domain-containing protein [Gemmatimonadales bacterium]
MSEISSRLSTALAGRYRIERELGAGGMATVYLADDVRHQRKVAVKVLRPELAAVIGAERFLAEITLTANLQHPHILPLYDSGGDDEFLFYVMPYVEGESLRDLLDREKQLGLDESLAIAQQVGAALDYAHRQGVVHRDIKPENILLLEGQAVLADFGIALAVQHAGGNRLTETGISLGTPQYMSPEQATGDRVLDARSDVYSLGAVLYEMLTGEPPVTGPTVQAMIAKLLTQRPVPVRAVRDTVPAALDHVVMRALARTPADRYPGAGEFVTALQHSLAPGGTPGAPRRKRAVWLVLAAVSVVVLALFASRLWRVRVSLPVLGRSDQLTAEQGLEIQPAISPDGRFVAYSAGNTARMRIFIRPVGGGRTIPLSDDSAAVETHARWSPDGSRLLFLTRNGVSIASALGGSSRPVVAPSPTAAVISAAWSPDGHTIAFVRADSLLAVPVEGGEVRTLGSAPNLHSCAWSPDDRWIACVSMNAESVFPGLSFGNIAPSAILLFPSEGGAPVQLVEAREFNQSPIWTPDGRQLLFVSNRDGPRDIYAGEVTSSGRLHGALRRVTTGLGAISISLSGDAGHLAYAVYSAKANIWSLPVPADPPVTDAAATQVTTGNQVIESMRVSRDGRWLLYDSNLRGNADIYRIPIGGGEPEQLTNDPADEFAPDLSPDGLAVAYHSWRSGTRDIEVKPLDGGPVEYVTATPHQESYPLWSPDGQAILFYDQTPPFTVRVTRRGADGRWTDPELLATPAVSGDWSPDGRRITYVRAATDRVAGPAMVASVTGQDQRELVQPSSATPPAAQVVWAPDGRTIYFKAHDAHGLASFWSVSPAGGAPRMLVRFPEPDRQSSRKDFATDGVRFFFAIEDRQSDVFVAELLAP